MSWRSLSRAARPAFEPLEERWLLSSVDSPLAALPLASAPAGLEALKIGWDGDTSKYTDATGPLGDATPQGATFRLDQQFGGSWWDANKTLSDSQDTLMCWAAAASNVLEWSGWGGVAGLTTSQQIFQYFEDHWTNQGGMMDDAWSWWFSGTNPSQGWYGWSQVDVPGGNFWSGYSFSSYFHDQENASQAMTSIDQWLRAGYATSIGIYGPGGHAITVWGFNYDPANPTRYYGVWVTDSDDDKSTDAPPSRLRYYEVAQTSGKWYLQNYYGSNSWYIGSVEALAPKPGASPLTISGIPDQSLSKNQASPNAIYLPKYVSNPKAPGAALSFSIVGNTNPSIGVTLVSGLWLSFAPATDWTGSSDVTVQVSDGATVSTDTFRVSVTNPAVYLAGTLTPIVLQNPDGPLNYNLVQLQVKNTGSGLASGLATMQLWASGDGVLGGSDDFKLADVRPYVYLPAGATGYYYFSYLVPGNVPAGTYNLVAVIDSSGEISKTGNLGAQAAIGSTLVMQNPDLSVAFQAVVLPTSAPGTWGVAVLRVNNAGPAWAYGQASIQIWASTDRVLGNGVGDVPLVTLSNYWVVLPPGAPAFYAAVFQLPTTMPTGNYSLMAVVDSSNTLAETNELNNTATYTASFAVVGSTPPALAGAGEVGSSAAPAPVPAAADDAAPVAPATPAKPEVSLAVSSSVGYDEDAAAPARASAASPSASTWSRRFVHEFGHAAKGPFDALAGWDVLWMTNA